MSCACHFGQSQTRNRFFPGEITWRDHVGCQTGLTSGGSSGQQSGAKSDLIRIMVHAPLLQMAHARSFSCE